jgi:hypothetical protein
MMNSFGAYFNASEWGLSVPLAKNLSNSKMQVVKSESVLFTLNGIWLPEGPPDGRTNLMIHHEGHGSKALKTKLPFVPPKPKAFTMAAPTLPSLASLGI